MNAGLTRGVFVMVATMAVGAWVFRVATAPDRIETRRNTARSVCVASGGEWVQTGNDQQCRKAGALFGR